MNTNDNRGLLVVIAIVLIGIFAVIFVEANQKSAGEEIGDSISDIIDDVDADDGAG